MMINSNMFVKDGQVVDINGCSWLLKSYENNNNNN